jgi:hypothetical protein
MGGGDSGGADSIINQGSITNAGCLAANASAFLTLGIDPVCDEHAIARVSEKIIKMGCQIMLVGR